MKDNLQIMISFYVYFHFNRPAFSTLVSSAFVLPEKNFEIVNI